MVQFIPCYEFETFGCKQIKIACQCKEVLGLEVCLVAFFYCVFFLHATVSLSFLLPLQALKLTRDVERTLCQICCQQVDSDTVYSLQPL